MTIGNGVTTIGSGTFYNCYSIRCIIIPNSVIKIGNNAFAFYNSFGYVPEVFYAGTAEEWSDITIDNGNSDLTKATRYYYSENEPTIEGNFWRYVDGEPTIWEYHIHSAIKVYAVEVGCHQNGYSEEHWYCEDCGLAFADGALTQIIDRNSVTFPYYAEIIHVDAVEAGCHENGNIEYWYCSECEAVFTDEALTQLSNINNVITPGYAVIYEVVSSSCTEYGYSSMYCFDCGLNFYDEIIPPLGHDYVDGNCTVCNITNPDYFSFNLLNDGTYEISAKDINNMPAVVNIPSEYNGIAVTSIGSYAFEYCTSLTSVTIGNSVTSIGYGAFYGCSNLTSINVDENNSVYMSLDGNIYSKDGKTLYAYAKGNPSDHFIIPDGVTTIANGALSSCNNLMSVTFPPSVTTVQAYAFAWSENLQNVYISDLASWCSIDFGTPGDGLYSSNPLTYAENLYLNNTLITELIIPSGIVEINHTIFCCYNKFVSVVIPDSVTSIGYDAFAYCYSLTIYCEAESKPSGWNDNWNSSNRPVIWGYEI